MAAKSQIPEIQGVEDPKVRNILTSMRTIINNLSGRSNGAINPLNSDTNLGGVINKINEILGRIQDTAIAPSVNAPIAVASMIRLNSANGYGSTNTMIRRFTNVVINQGTDITYVDSAALGATFTINVSGVYSISYTDNFGAASWLGISLNSTQLTTGVTSTTLSTQLGTVHSMVANLSACFSISVYLAAGSVIRAHTEGGATGNNNQQFFTIIRVS